MSIVWIGLALAAFGVLHSWLAAAGVKDWARRTWGMRAADGWYRLAYNLLAGVSLLPALALAAWLPDGAPLWRFPGWLLALTIPTQLAALAGAGLALWRTDLPRFLGLRQAGRFLAGAAEPRDPPSLRTDGLHAWTRHPLYTCSLILLWLIPVMTPNRLAFNLGCTVYFYVGSILEERKLLAEFGEAYRAYQAKVRRF